ncbi:transposase [Streptomyces galilaeus]
MTPQPRWRRQNSRTSFWAITWCHQLSRTTDVTNYRQNHGRDAIGQLSCFPADFYDCVTGRADELFKLTDALLCADGPAKTLAGLALAREHLRGHGAMHGALNQGRIEVARLRRVPA